MKKKHQGLFKKKNLNAIDAKYEAQKIAYAPLIFQAVRVMRDRGILARLDQAGKSGISAGELASESNLDLYSIETLLESGLSAGVVEVTDDDHFVLSKIGYFLEHDDLTRINMDYNHYVCYQGMYHLDEAIQQEKPAGLRVFGNHWETLYQALPHLPEETRRSWYAFDHYYSDSAYPQVLPIIFRDHPRSLVDIGTNMGKFTILATSENEDLEVMMVDLPDQLELAVKNVDEAGLSGRVESTAVDLLMPGSKLPAGYDIYWLSQLLSCFSKTEIIEILAKCRAAMENGAKLYILETCWDRQAYEAAAYSLINTSLYFTCMASGNSKMYHSGDLVECAESAGLVVDKIYDKLGICHTLFECSAG
jgi:hypothetical protein